MTDAEHIDLEEEEQLLASDDNDTLISKVNDESSDAKNGESEL